MSKQLEGEAFASTQVMWQFNVVVRALAYDAVQD